MRKPLENLLVVEFCQYLAGPSAGLRLADLGARVIKIERPPTGDGSRVLNLKDLWLDDESFSFHAINRGKESVAVDLKDARDQDAVTQLVAQADVLIHSFRPGVMERLGLGYADVRALNPGIIYGEVSGYGAEGPWRDRPGQDLLVQSRSGLVWLSGNRDHPPVPFGLALVDSYTGVHLVQGILSALVRRERTGVGAHVAVSLLESALDLQFEVLTTHLNDGGRLPNRSRLSNAHAYLGAPYGIYETSDGYIAISMGEIPRLGALIGCDELRRFASPKERFTRRDEIKELLATHLRSETTAHWIERLESGNYWCSKTLTWEQLMEEDGFKELDMVQEVVRSTGSRYRTTRCPIRIDGDVITSSKGSPRVGEHTSSVLEDLEKGALGGWRANERAAQGASEVDARPLKDVVVLDFSQFLSGPSAALRLADLGARVIKVERPDGGDICRSLYISDTDLGDESTLFHSINRNKEGVSLNLKDPEDLERARALIQRADVLIENFRPGVMERLGLGYDAVRKINPRLVYASITGYGSEGPWSSKPGQDLLVQAMSGIVWLSGNADDPPVPMGLSVVDMFAGQYLAQGILACLARRARTGQGARVELSLFESAIDIQFEILTQFLNDGGQPPERSQVCNGHAYLGAPYGIYETADGYLALAMGSVTQLGELLECDALAAYPDPDDWFAKRDEIKRALSSHLKTRTTAEWLARLEPADFWCAEVFTWPQLLQHDGFQVLDMLQTVRRHDGGEMQTTRCPIRIDGAVLKSAKGAPRIGEDNARILDEFLRADHTTI